MNPSLEKNVLPAGSGVVPAYSRGAILQWLEPAELQSYRTSKPDDVLEMGVVPDCLRLVSPLTADETERLAGRLSEGEFGGIIVCDPAAGAPVWILLSSARALLRRIDKIDWHRAQSSAYWAHA